MTKSKDIRTNRNSNIIVSKTTASLVAIMIGKKITVKTFPGATASDMKHQPTLEKNPQLVVLHVGTNDIQHKECDKIAKEEQLGNVSGHAPDMAA